MFLENKYTKWYFNIINSAKSESRKKVSKSESCYMYYENHHIIPRSLGGDDAKENLVLLTMKEHYICHLLLTKMQITNENRFKMQSAFRRFCYGDENNSRKFEFWRAMDLEKYSDEEWMINFKKKISDSCKKTKACPIWKVEYDYIYEKFRNKKYEEIYGDEKAAQIKTKQRKWSKDRYEEIGYVARSDMSGKNNPMYGKPRTEEWKAEHSEKMKGRYSGEKNPMYGKTHTEEVRKQLSESKLGKIWIHNGIETVLHDPNEKIPEGWLRGKLCDMTEAKKVISEMRKGTKFITNGIDTKVIKADEPVPEGWKYGRTMKNTKKDR